MPSPYNELAAACAAALALCGLAVAAPDAPGSKPGDDAMSCDQIAMEMMPYAQQLRPNLQAMGKSQQQLLAQSQALGQQQKNESQALTAMATAGALDPSGASKRAYQAAVVAQAAKHRRESEALANSDLAKQTNAQTQQFMQQGEGMKNDARLQRLLQLGQQKGCTAK
jgi:hypothetical protein